MLNTLALLTDLSTQNFLLTSIAVFVAGLVRGFSGFALSATLMASIVVLIPPVQLIPICYLLEAVASIVLFRGGMRKANMNIVWGLAIGSAIGVPIGLFATTTIDTGISKLIALLLIIGLTFWQLFNLQVKFLSTKKGLYTSGITAGIVTGLASVGGMVVAIFVLSRKSSPAEMRASLIMFLFIGMFTSLIYLVLYSVMDQIALTRGLVFSPILVIGIYLGTKLFRPSLAHLYKRFCLLLLMLLCTIGLLRYTF